MDLKTIMATLAVLGAGTSLGGCGGDAKKSDAADTKTDAKTDAKEVPHAKGGEGEDAKANAEGEMSCAPGQCGEGMCGAEKKTGDKPDEKALANQGEKDDEDDKSGEAAAGNADDDPAT